MSGSTSNLDAIVDRMMERLQQENPTVDYYKKSKEKKEKVPRQKKPKEPIKQTLH
jgi:hypothetical protein